LLWPGAWAALGVAWMMRRPCEGAENGWDLPWFSMVYHGLSTSKLGISVIFVEFVVEWFGILMYKELKCHSLVVGGSTFIFFGCNY
jgi:hypothetical protein